MASPKKTIPQLTAITIVNGEFLLVIFDGTSTKKIKVSDFVKYIVEKNAAEGGGNNPGGTAPENPENGKTTWIDVSDPENPSLKLFINNKWVNLSSPDAGDMLAEIYDPNGNATDFYEYVDEAIRTAVNGTSSSQDLANMTSHMENNALHTNATEKASWDSAVEHTSTTGIHTNTTEKNSWNSAATHAEDTTVHTNTTEKNSWNSAATHTTNTTVHTNATEKASWNGASTHASNSNIHVTAADKTNWNSKATMAQVNSKLSEISFEVAGVGAGAGGHNNTYRGKNLGTSVTAAQWAAIADGSFADMYIGDYWVIGSVTYRIAAFDYYLHTGGTEVTKHHVTIVPDTAMGTAKMNDTATTTGGYYGSAMYKTNLATIKNTINTAFGSTHILSHKQYFSNAVTNGRVTGASEYDSTVDLMNEINVYGCPIYLPICDGTNIPSNYTYDKSQFPLFKFRPDLIMDNTRQWYWLRDVVSGSSFANVGSDGRCYGSTNANDSTGGVRPVFNIIGN